MCCRRIIVGVNRYYATEGIFLVFCEECKEIEDVMLENEKCYVGCKFECEKCEEIFMLMKE